MSGSFHVYRVDTASSTYHVGIRFYGNTFGPVYLIGTTSDGVPIFTHDLHGRVGERRIAATLPEEWVGHPLRIGGVHTSAIKRVEREMDQAALRRFMRELVKADPEATVAALTASGEQAAMAPEVARPLPRP